MKSFLYFLNYCFFITITVKAIAQPKPAQEMHVICIDTVYYKASPYGIPVSIDNMTKYPGLPVAVSSKVYGYKKKGNIIIICLGAAYPNQRLTVLLNGNTNFAADSTIGKNIKVIGKVIMFKNKPTIKVKDDRYIQLQKQ